MATPKSTVVDLMHEVPFDPSYNHTMLFNNIDEQIAYFNSKRITTAMFNDLSYQRYESGTIRIQSDMTLLDNANYLRFYNQHHEDKSFYAFIIAVRYISDSVVEIDYQIDNIQTWMFDYSLNPCYVEREHAISDQVGDNRVPENLETGDVIQAGMEKIDHWNSNDNLDGFDVIIDSNFCVIATQSPNGDQSSFQMNGVAGSMYLRIVSGVEGLESLLNEFRNGATQSLEPIMSITMFPKYYKPESFLPLVGKSWILEKDQTIGFNGFFAYDPKTRDVKRYYPKNNKLYCYPYNYMLFESPDGSNNTLKFEDFQNNNSHMFVTKCAVYPEVQVICVPIAYQAPYDYDVNGKDHSFAENYNLSHALFSKSYPTCAVASDAFSAWFAQNKFSMPVTSSVAQGVVSGKRAAAAGMGGWDVADAAVRDGLTTALNPATLAQLGGKAASWYTDIAFPAGKNIRQRMRNRARSTAQNVANLVSEIGDDLAAIYNAKAMPDTAVTKANHGGVIHWLELDCFKVYYMKIRPEMAEIIDKYFSAFGYATKMFKVPNIVGRRYWNYIKTLGCTINGNVPVEAERDITAAYDRGITFWHDANAIHNYSLDNYIV